VLPCRCVRTLATVFPTAILAAALALAATSGTVTDECCEVAGCEGELEDSGASDECPPGCDDGCVCCARGTAVPATTAPLLAAREVGCIVYLDRIELPPSAPDPRERDRVPRRSTS
jgi:hypothetical protein